MLKSIQLHLRTSNKLHKREIDIYILPRSVLCSTLAGEVASGLRTLCLCLWDVFPTGSISKCFGSSGGIFQKKKHLSDRGSVLSSGSSYVWVSAVSEDTQVTSVHSDSCKLPRGFSLCSRWSEGLCTGSQ